MINAPQANGTSPVDSPDEPPTVPDSSRTAAPRHMTSRARRSFAAAVGGWAMDGFDIAIFALVASPALAELLPKSGVAATGTNVGVYAQLSAAVFLAGWGLSFIWGPVADRYGRRPAMIGSILTFSVFTALAGAAGNLWIFMACRFLAAVGVGGEWALAGTAVAESVPERLRVRLGGLLHSATYVGAVLTGVLYLAAGHTLGWRGMFLFGLAPALLVLFLRLGVKEPERFEAHRRQTGQEAGSLWAPLRTVLGPSYRARTWGNLVLLVVCVMGLWAGTTFGATAVSTMADSAGRRDATRLASLITLVGSLSTIVGCWCVPALTRRLGRRGTLVLLYVLMIVGILGSYAYAYPRDDIAAFFLFAPVLGFGGANFAVFTIWLPEQYPTRIRATAFAFTTTLSRWAAAVGTLLIAYGISVTHSLALPLALTAVPFFAGILLTRLVPETGATLPD
ncbi:MFS transporter [Streptomyces shenzhenensis]|uniref:MFS transporter n=1 Tax=Streptomyces shenzhenensis TaxID=943815 RepID=UPI001F459AC9|nr:MFS transporter [Streptomyces shenzhenensis]